MVEIGGEFVPPPEAPIFEPTWEEFQDPLTYIEKIRPVAEKSGICKIRPPADWQPPFAVDVDTFRFTPRLQRLNELEAKTRIKLNFLDHLAKFWELQGSPLKIPMVERKYLDLYDLKNIVHEEGGFEVGCKERKWAKISWRMGYPAGRGVGSTLRGHYEKILYPYDIFLSGATIDPEEVARWDPEAKHAAKEEKVKLEQERELKEVVKTEEPKREAPEGEELSLAQRRSKRVCREIARQMDLSSNAELKKLQFYGPGPKAAVAEAKRKEEEELQLDETGKLTRMKTRDKKPVSYVDQYICHICGRGDGEEYMLLCDGCDDAFHTYCLIPPLTTVPTGDWRCPKCVAKECNRPTEAYGFEQSKREYSLQSYGEMADQFKMDYFNMPAHMVPCSAVEKEFWRLVNCIEEDVVVQYGADVHAMEMGSGFPTKQTQDLFPEDEEYIKCGWNLNNLPVLPQSVLQYINVDITGMKVPWCYVGMCFSSFAWHTEDHWSYSVNYMHWGEPKTWYGVPGAKAELLEQCMKKNAPELFEQSPDLLHHITTQMNPNVLMAYGVPIVRTNQCAGEFIITFPRSYHGGFNQGYNFAEAVNFCPADWIPIGRDCVEHYRMLHRNCVFSHDELICKMAAEPDKLDLTLAATVHEDMIIMVETEKKLRKILLDRGVVEAEREAFELLPDDERQCDFCKTTCFLSAVTCSCSPNKLVCVYHIDELCSCSASKLCLRYRYTLDELPAMLHRLKVRAELFDNWAYKAKTAIEAPQDQKLDLEDMRKLVVEAEDKKFPDSALLQALSDAVSDAEKCANVATLLVSTKVRTRTRQAGDSKYVARLTLDELDAFCEQVLSLPCRIKEAQLIQDLVNKVKDFQLDAQLALNADVPDSKKLENLLETGTTLDIELPELPQLKQVMQQARWLEQVHETRSVPGDVTLEVIRKLIQAGVGLAPHRACERAMATLQELLTLGERWEEKARVCLQARPRHAVSTIEVLVNEAESIASSLPNVAALKEFLRKAKEWNSKVEAIQNAEHYPYLEVLENLVNKGRPVPIRLDQLLHIESQVSAAKSWRERTARTFLKKNSTYSLVEVLSPRTDIGAYQNGKNKKKKIKESEKDKDKDTDGSIDSKVEENMDPAAIVAAFKVAEKMELDSIRTLRSHNLEKHKLLESAKYCLCRRGPAGFMLQCELCRDWFHSTCVPLPKSANIKNKNSHAAAVAATRDLKFMCPLCLRSRRPRLETILSLLVSLQKLPVRLPEGEALQCLTERAMAWQDRARQSLATDELASALAKLSILSQKAVEEAAREKTEKIISAELLKAASNPDLQGHLHNVTQCAFGSTQQHTDNIPNPPSPPTSDDATWSETELQSQGTPGMPSEHTYSSASKSSAGATPRKHARKSPLLSREMEAPVLELSVRARGQLEQLMMEGDLLEVSLDETQHIWRILQACQSPGADRILHFADSDGELIKDKPEKIDKEKQKKKKKKEMEIIEKSKEIKKKLKKDKVGKLLHSKLKDVKDKKKRRRRKFKKDGPPTEKPRYKKGLLGQLMLVDDEDDECSAMKCLKPAGEEVNWVQCDGCELWFHLLCVGLAEDEVSENEDYICYQCRQSGSDDTTTLPLTFVKKPSPVEKLSAKVASSLAKPPSFAALVETPVDSDENLAEDEPRDAFLDNKPYIGGRDVGQSQVTSAEMNYIKSEYIEQQSAAYVQSSRIEQTVENVSQTMPSTDSFQRGVTQVIEVMDTNDYQVNTSHPVIRTDSADVDAT